MSGEAMEQEVVGGGCGAPCGPFVGTNIIQSGRLRLLAGTTGNLVIEIRNGDFDFRFISGWTEPFSDLIDITQIQLRRPGDKSDSQLLRGSPMRLQQFTSDPRFGQALQFMDALDSAENKSQVIFSLQNLEAIQAVETTISLMGFWKTRPTQPIDRRVFAGDPCTTPDPQRREAEPHRGPVSGVDPNGGAGTRYMRPAMQQQQNRR